MEESTWYTKQRSQLEDSLWTFKQRYRVLQDFQKDIQGIWQDDAATEINGRYFRPHEEDSQQTLTALARQLSFLSESDAKLQMASQLILEANRLSEEIEKLITFANQDISRSHSEYSVFQEQNSAARSELPTITQLINQANSFNDN
ncbi:MULTISPECIES: hypothetical protein [Nostocales]|jgi:hypothetical protein|uniref:Uncharacterized protein n=1 Tax=Dolichospermum flos-aquae UHCC 0037 TaxID=2590026 RepID=A0ACC7SB02_DOLFA|nr:MULTISPECIES: hypothetical protein [Nostocales]MBO1063212.1 hypothetical protein [Anabaena sp. 54]MTJ45539.1 hypothetical protein [Dolichospermum flos-aquae UHCC 0037]